MGTGEENTEPAEANLMSKLTRRQFVQTAGTAAAGVLLAKSASSFGEDQEKSVCVGVVGVGGRGTGLLHTLLNVKGVVVPAICDVHKGNLDRGLGIVENKTGQRPEGYSDGDYAFQDLMDRDDLDAVIIATPWEWHTPMAVYCMRAGKYAGVEVPACQSINDCWELVNTYEYTKVPCMMLENWSFRRDNLAVLNMIRQGLMGQMVHCHCAHSHDCVDHWFFDATTGADRWGAKYLIERNRDQYPTHQLGPVLSWLDIGYGDYFDYITSTATGSFGINDYFTRKFGADHPSAKRKYAQGDIVSSTIKTKNGKTIVSDYDMQLPRPYDNRWTIQGTRGLYNEQRNSVYLEGRTPAYHEWEDFDPYQEEYEHPWWKEMGDGSAYGHGGTDYLELKLFVEAVQNKTRTPLDVYDAVIKSSVGPLSELSIAQGSKPVKVPDFTRGKWKTNKPYFGV